MTLHLTATKMAEYIMERANISKQRKAVFIYGCELTLSTIASVLSIIILSIFLNAIYSSFVFLLVFIGIRLFAGGYHAKTYSHCFLLTNFVYLLSFLLSEYVIISLHRPIKTILLFISAAVILVLAPIRHKNHPLSEQTYRKNAAIGRTITILISMITVWLASGFLHTKKQAPKGLLFFMRSRPQLYAACMLPLTFQTGGRSRTGALRWR